MEFLERANVPIFVIVNSGTTAIAIQGEKIYSIGKLQYRSVFLRMTGASSPLHDRRSVGLAEVRALKNKKNSRSDKLSATFIYVRARNFELARVYRLKSNAHDDRVPRNFNFGPSGRRKFAPRIHEPKQR